MSTTQDPSVNSISSKTDNAATSRNNSNGLSSSAEVVSELKSNLSLINLVKKSLKQSLDLFTGNVGIKAPEVEECVRKRIKMKIIGEYSALCDVNSLRKSEEKSEIQNFAKIQDSEMSRNDLRSNSNCAKSLSSSSLSKLIQSIVSANSSSCSASFDLPNEGTVSSTSVSLLNHSHNTNVLSNVSAATHEYSKNASSSSTSLQLSIRLPPKIPQPQWHRPWKLHRVISGHQGWVQCLAVDPTNEWFASGGNDRLIKIWNMASGRLRLSLTGHVNAVRGLAISDRHPYMFSCSEDNKVKCWDLEQNKIVRDYHGHLSGVYCLSLHPSLDVLATGGRDCVVRVWDIRTKNAIHVLSGHEGTVMTINTQNSSPQLISGSQDKMVRLWDLRKGCCSVVLTNHKKSVRAMAIHPHEYTFCSCAADNIKVWICPNGVFNRNISGHNAIINCAAIKSNSVHSSIIVAGTNNGNLVFWDWRSGYKYDNITSKVQPGSLESENGIFACAFDKSETRLITGECDKTIKIWKEDEDSNPTTHPINWIPPREFKKY